MPIDIVLYDDSADAPLHADGIGQHDEPLPRPPGCNATAGSSSSSLYMVPARGWRPGAQVSFLELPTGSPVAVGERVHSANGLHDQIGIAPLEPPVTDLAEPQLHALEHDDELEAARGMRAPRTGSSL